MNPTSPFLKVETREEIVSWLEHIRNNVDSVIDSLKKAKHFHEIHSTIKSLGHVAWCVQKIQNDGLLRMVQGYGQIVKLQTNQELHINECYEKEIKQFLTKYKKAKDKQSMYPTFDYYYAFIIPKGTLGVITSTTSSKKHFTYKVAIANPVTNKLSRSVMEVEPKNLSFEITQEEKDLFHPYVAELVVKREKSNLHAVKKIHELTK